MNARVGSEFKDESLMLDLAIAMYGSLLMGISPADVAIRTVSRPCPRCGFCRGLRSKAPAYG